MYAEDSPVATTLRFSWIIEGRLAASARPGRYGPLHEHLKYLKDSGVRTIINLTEERYEFPDGYRRHFSIVHVPILDGEAPSEDEMRHILEVIEEDALAGERPCLVHCQGGIGRTATVIAPVLMQFEGMDMTEAIELLRRSGRRTETMQQFTFLQEWASQENRESKS